MKVFSFLNKDLSCRRVRFFDRSCVADRRRLNRRAGERVIQAGFPFVPWEESVIGLNLVRPGVDFVDAGIRDPRDPLRAGGFDSLDRKSVV